MEKRISRGSKRGFDDHGIWRAYFGYIEVEGEDNWAAYPTYEREAVDIYIVGVSEVGL